MYIISHLFRKSKHLFAKMKKFFHILFSGDFMFRIFTFRQLSIFTIILCTIMILGTALSYVQPVVFASSEAGVKVPIIMYHQISANKSVIGDYAIPLQMLEEDFLYMKNNNITPVSFKQLTDFTQNGIPLPENPVCITFDDGQKTFLTQVLPLLEKYNFPANVNIIGSLTLLYTENNDNNDSYAYLNTEDIKNLNNNPLVEIGCHTYNFHSLTSRRGAGKLKEEGVTDYRKTIENDLKKFKTFYYDITSDNTEIFAYPYGIRNDTLQEILKENGYSITLTCRECVNILNVGSSLYELGRFNRPYKLSTQSFFSRIF